MEVYVFGNKDVPDDSRAIEVAERLEGEISGVSFIFVEPNEDVPFANEDRAVVLDAIEGIREVTVIGADDIDALVLPPRGSVHDFDLAFQLKYLKKIGKLGAVTIVAVPRRGTVDHRRVQSILRKLVAHDMQGS